MGRAIKNWTAAQEGDAANQAVRKAVADLGRAVGLSEVSAIVERAQAQCGQALAAAGAATISLRRQRLLREKAACMEQVIARLRAGL